jgi:hypothetical protein
MLDLDLLNAEAPPILDRRVEVIVGSDAQRTSVRRVSDLRDAPFVVLLGEPGIGKSTVLASEAAREGAHVIKVRALMSGARVDSRATLYLDALDEYRIDGQPADKAYGLARAIEAVDASRWRLACRSEDWRKEADIAAIQGTTKGVPIVVAQLRPLDRASAASVLQSVGEKDPEAFLRKADAFGATGFIESPLSLTLLRKAVEEGGAWPPTRFVLFSVAARRLAYERNSEYKFVERRSIDDIVAAAADACLLLLASGARSIWRSNDEPPFEGTDTRAYLTAHDLGFDRALMSDVLDTTLFRGEGEAFEPIHRTIAEFLGGQALADAVAGRRRKAVLPLGRAIALVTGSDGRPPTELRGLHAWFAAHLASAGDEPGAMRLIEKDAVGVMAYGDAAVFGTAARRAILAELDTDDPWFRVSEVGETAVAGLAGEDLAADFRAALVGPPGRSHRLWTVFEVLTTGKPVHSLRPLLRDIALDPRRPESQRWRAADAWVHGADDQTTAQRELFDAVAAEPISVAREALRAHLAGALPASALGIGDIISVLADYQQCPEDNTMGRLSRLEETLASSPRPELFDEPIGTAIPRDGHGGHRVEVEHFLGRVLAETIRSTPELTAGRLLRWIVNTGGNDSSPGSKLIECTAEWLGGGEDRDVALFDAVLAAEDLESSPWMPTNTYITITGRAPSANIVRCLLKTKSGTNSERRIAVAVEIANRFQDSSEAYWAVYARVASSPEFSALLERLTTCPVEKWRQDDYRRKQEWVRRDAETQRKNVEILTPLCDEMRAGRCPHQLDWAANTYFHGERKTPDQNALEHLSSVLDEPVLEAILAGWKHLATEGIGTVDAAMLGKAEAESRHYFVESAAIAGMERLLVEGVLPPHRLIPLSTALVLLKRGWIVANAVRRERLEQWAVERLDIDPALGSGQLLALWSAALDAGATRLLGDAILCRNGSLAARGALSALLNTRRSMPSDALRAALRAASTLLEPQHTFALASAALKDALVVGESRMLWSFAAFAVDPVGQGEGFAAEYKGSDIKGLFGTTVSEGLMTSFRNIEDSARARRESIVIRMLGPKCLPVEVRARLVSGSEDPEVVQGSINWLSGCQHLVAGEVLDELISDSDLVDWRQDLLHVRAQRARVRRDRAFVHPTAFAISDALRGGPPVNAADLRSIVLEELDR